MKKENNISQELLETIERYLNGTMDESEHNIFSERMEADPQLQQQVEDVRTMLVGIEQAVLTGKMEDFHAEIPTEEHAEKVIPLTSKKRNRFAYIGIAASIIAVIGLFWIFTQKSETEQLFAEYFVADPGLPTNMGDIENFEFYDAMVDYKQGDYSEAIDKWSNQLTFKKENDTLHYFLGVAQLASGNETGAIEHLKTVTDEATSVFTKEAWYYLGLAYLKSEDLENAKESLANSENKNASELLTKINP